MRCFNRFLIPLFFKLLPGVYVWYYLFMLHVVLHILHIHSIYIYIYIYTYIHICVCVCVCECVHVRTCVCVYVYMYTNLHMDNVTRSAALFLIAISKALVRVIIIFWTLHETQHFWNILCFWSWRPECEWDICFVRFTQCVFEFFETWPKMKLH